MNEYYTMVQSIELTGLTRATLTAMCKRNNIEYLQDETKHLFIKKKSIHNIIEWQTEHEPIPGFPDYTISKNGEIRKVTGKKAPKIMSPTEKYDGYLKIALRDINGKKCYFLIHQLVALTYIPNPDNLPQINHIDEDKKNNSVENLEWCTVKYNCNYGGRNTRISETHRAKYRK